MYNHKKNPIDLNVTRLAVGFGDDEKIADDLVLKTINLVHAVERAQGFKLTKLRYGGSQKSLYGVSRSFHAWVFEADRRWMHASPLISFYCMIIRMGFDYDGSKWNDFLSKGNIKHSPRDRLYCRSVYGFWDNFVGQRVSKVFGRSRKKNYPRGFITHDKGFRWFGGLKQIPAEVSHWKHLGKDN